MGYIEKYNNGHKYASTYVRIFDDDTVQLVSYTTTVIEITLATCQWAVQHDHDQAHRLVHAGTRVHVPAGKTDVP